MILEGDKKMATIWIFKKLKWEIGYRIDRMGIHNYLRSK
jgi:hypothetical protein